MTVDLAKYVDKFIPNLSEMIAPLRELLGKNVSLHWGNEQVFSFRKIKEVPVSNQWEYKWVLQDLEMMLYI